MPDKDIFDRNLAKGWRNVARCHHHGIDPKDAANRARLAVQRNLKTLGGFFGCEELSKFLLDSPQSSPEIALKILRRGLVKNYLCRCEIYRSGNARLYWRG